LALNKAKARNTRPRPRPEVSRPRLENLASRPRPRPNNPAIGSLPALVKIPDLHLAISNGLLRCYIPPLQEF